MEDFSIEKINENWEEGICEKGIDAVDDYVLYFGISIDFFPAGRYAFVEAVLDKIKFDYEKASKEGEEYFEEYKKQYDSRIRWFNTHKNWVEEHQKSEWDRMRKELKDRVRKQEMDENSKYADLFLSFLNGEMEKVDNLNEIKLLRKRLEERERQNRIIRRELQEELDKEKQINRDLKIQLKWRQQKTKRKAIELNSEKSGKHNLSSVS